MTSTTIGLGRRTGILALVTGLILALTAMMSASPARAANWTAHEVKLWDEAAVLIFHFDGTNVVVPADGTTAEVKNADLIVTSGDAVTVLHISCSEDLTETPGAITLGGVTHTIGDFFVDSTNPAGMSRRTCGEDIPVTSTSLVIDKTQVDEREVPADETFTFSVDCEGIDLGEHIITGSGTIQIDGVPHNVECTVTETDAAGAASTTAGDAPDPTDEGNEVTVDVGTDGATAYFVNTFQDETPEETPEDETPEEETPDTTEVLEEVLEDVEVLDETLEDEEEEEVQATLADTGLPALVLALLGLAAIGGGTALVRRR